MIICQLDHLQDMTTYQKRLAALREEIAELEAQNVGKKDWTLMGEAGSRARPQNSLLEEDLDFDRVMKAVPVITEEVVQGLEERIKARILENNFDDVVRIRPRENKPFLPSRFLELQDTKSTQSLAQIYENDYVASQTEGAATDDRDGKLKKEHEEIDKLWENICGKLDALCNAHYIPKQVRIHLIVKSLFCSRVFSPRLRFLLFQIFRPRHWNQLFLQPSQQQLCLLRKKYFHLSHRSLELEVN